MTSSLDEAMRLLHKWKNESAPLVVGASRGSPVRPNTFAFSFLGTVREISGSSLKFAGDKGSLFVADLGRAAFEYVEPADRELDLSNREREEAIGVTSGTLSAHWPDGYSCFFCKLGDDIELAEA